MRNLLIAATLACLAGCVSKPYGNYAPQADAMVSRVMVADTVAQLVAIFPPARMRLNVIQETPDRFGQNLVTSLRSRGYAVMEYPASAEQPARGALPLSYVVDSPADAAVFRVTVRVGRQTLSRAYASRPEGVYPAGVWARKE